MPKHPIPTLKEACAAALAWSQSPNFTAKEDPEPPCALVDFFLGPDIGDRLRVVVSRMFAGTLRDRAIAPSSIIGHERGHRGHVDPMTVDPCNLLYICTAVGAAHVNAWHAVLDYDGGKLSEPLRTHWAYSDFREKLGLLLRKGAIRVFFCRKCLKEDHLD